MNTKNNSNNNLFKWATKELSQDAFIAWLVSEKDIGNEFLKKLLEIKAEVKIEEVETQKNSIDVFIELTSNNDTYAVIIEDKTNSWLHDNQMEKYIEKVADKKYKKIYFILIKTGDIFFWERDSFEEYKNSIKKSRVKKIKDFLESGKEIDIKLVTLNEYKDAVIGINADNNILRIYKEYLNDKCDDLKDDWRSESIKKDSFCKDILPEEWQELECVFKKADGRGKKNYEFLVKGLCDKVAPNNSDEVLTVKERYYLLPVIILEDDAINISLNFQLYANTKNEFGYFPYKKLKEYFKNNNSIIDDYQAIKGKIYNHLLQEYDQKGWKINKPKENTLKCCSFRFKYSHDKKYGDIKNEIKNKLVELLDITKMCLKIIEE